MNAPCFSTGNTQADTIEHAAVAEIEALLGALFDVQSKRRIMNVWRAGRISTDDAAMLISECGLEGVE